MTLTPLVCPATPLIRSTPIPFQPKYSNHSSLNSPLAFLPLLLASTALKPYPSLKVCLQSRFFREAFPYHRMMCSYHPYYEVLIISCAVLSNPANDTWLQIRVLCILVSKFTEGKDWNLFFSIHSGAACRELGHIDVLEALILN